MSWHKVILSHHATSGSVYFLQMTPWLVDRFVHYWVYQMSVHSCNRHQFVVKLTCDIPTELVVSCDVWFRFLNMAIGFLDIGYAKKDNL